MSTNSLDCILVGYNDLGDGQMNESAKSPGAVSGAAKTILHNTIELSGRRMNYMGLLNAALRETLCKDPGLHVMKMPNLAICYLKSFLTKRGLNVEHVNFFNEEKERLAALLRQGVNAVAITTTFYVDAAPINEVVAFVRQHNPDVLIVVGGPHVFNVCNEGDVTTQNYLLRAIGADIYINEGQGEETLSRLLHELRKNGQPDIESIPNLVYSAKLKARFSGKTARPLAVRAGSLLASFARTGREIENNGMDENVIDWDYFPKDFFTPTVQMRTARSCAFKCAFCSYPVMAGPLTLTSIEAIEKEMTELKSNSVRNLVFIDDTFNVPLPRYKQLLRMMIKNKFDFNWFSYFRCSNSDEEAFDLMAESGCKGVFLGIESGDQDILVKMNKAAAVPRYEFGIERLNHYGIISFASFIVGFPGETRESVQNTIDFIERSRPTFYRAQLYYHRTNLPIEQKAEEYGLRGGGYNWQHNSMGWKEACDLIEEMYQTVEGSTILPEATFDFWSIPYLMGMGIRMEHIVEFVRTSQKLLVNGISAGRGAPRLHEERAVFEELVALGGKMAPHLHERVL
jgi:radical SAM PhpK family P-methyltransferase